MSVSRVQLIAEALIARIAAVSGIGDTGLVPVPQTRISTYPACFLAGVEGEAEPGTMGGAGRKDATADYIWVIYTRDVDAFLTLADVRKSINDAIETTPYDLGVDGVMRPFCKGFKLYNPATSTEIGVAELTVNVRYVEAYGSA